MSVLHRKSWQDIRRRPGRSIFTVFTIAAAVVGLSFFALPALMDRAMDERIANDRLHDIQIQTKDLALDEDDIGAIRELLGVEALALRTTYQSELLVGERREEVLLVGVPDFDAQEVNVVAVEEGTAPAQAEALTEVQNARSGRLDASVGERYQVLDNNGQAHELAISGAGRTLQYSQVASVERVVLYVPQETVNEIAGVSGANTLDILVNNAEDAEAIGDDIQDVIRERHEDVVFTDLPDIREPGTWPGQDVFNNFSALFYVGAILALVSAVALISNTMTTMVAEQRREIAIMKAIGGQRRQIAYSFLRSVVLLATAGSVVGVLLGIPFSNMLARFVGGEFLATTPGWGIAWTVVIISVPVGILGTTLAAVPALVRAARIPVQQGLTASIDTGGGGSGILRHLPLSASNLIGPGNIMRRKARALGTVVQVGIAVGVALGFLALGVTITNLTGQTWDTLKWDVVVIQTSNVAFDEQAGALLGDIDGVERAVPTLYNNLRVAGTQYETWGLDTDLQLYEPDLASGRWFVPEDGESRASVAVIGRALANANDLQAGDTMVASSARGDVELEVIGIDSRVINNGDGIFVPFETFQEILGRDDTNAYWVVAGSEEHATIDRIAANAEDTLTAAGYPATTEIHYVQRQQNISSNETLVTVLAAMGIPIVAIGLIGLVNMMTMNVIERTREVGILRCIGAGSRDIRRIFRFEALLVAVLGWVVAVPLGWLIGRILVAIVAQLFNFGAIPYSFPIWYPPIALIATVVLAWIVVIPPLRRASGLHPGDALRYE